MEDRSEYPRPPGPELHVDKHDHDMQIMTDMQVMNGDGYDAHTPLVKSLLAHFGVRAVALTCHTRRVISYENWK